MAISKEEQEEELNHEEEEEEEEEGDGFPSTMPRGTLLTSSSRSAEKGKGKKKGKSGGFESLGLSSLIFRGVKRKGYQVPTPIQRKALPLVLAGYDVVAMARTGSGKTAAFLIPLLERLKMHAPKGSVRALVLSPTRELALQTYKFCNELGRFTDLRTAILVGGDSMETQFEKLANNPDIIIATPGRLMHHLSEVEGMSLRTVEYVVFDEADRLFEMGFADQLRQILGCLSDTRQTLLFSATLPRLLAEFAKAGLRDPHIIRLDTETRISPDLKLLFFTLRREEKPAALIHLIREQISPDQQTLIFVSTKHHVEFLHDLLRKEGVDLSVVYGSMDQAARKIHLAKFRARKTMLLLVTDVAARGIDIPLLDNVINYDYPCKPKLFVHRVGRAARAGRIGTAFSFMTSDDKPYLLDLHLYLSKSVWPAPTEEEWLADTDKVLSKLNEGKERGDTIYGRLPQSVLDYGVEKFRKLIDESSELQALQKACQKAFGLYSRTKPPPSLESVRRAKKFSEEGMHPLFRARIGSLEAAAAAFTENLKVFRPKQTVLEAEGEVAKSKNNQPPIAQAGDVMKKKRAIHEITIAAVKQKKASLNHANDQGEPDENNFVPEEHQAKKSKRTGVGNILQSFKDDEFYINAVPSNRHLEAGLAVRSGDTFGFNQMESDVLDLLPDDKEGVKKQKSVYHWDKKHKKYVKLHQGEKVSAAGKITNESGFKVNMGNRGLYKKWKEGTHKQVSQYGEEDETTSETSGRTGGRGGRGGRRGGTRDGKYGRGSVPNAHVKTELRDIEQVRKKRQQLQTRKIITKKGKGSKKGPGKFGNKDKGTHGGRGGSRGGHGGSRGGRGGSRGGRPKGKG